MRTARRRKSKRRRRSKKRKSKRRKSKRKRRSKKRKRKRRKSKRRRRRRSKKEEENHERGCAGGPVRGRAVETRTDARRRKQVCIIINEPVLCKQRRRAKGACCTSRQQ